MSVLCEACGSPDGEHLDSCRWAVQFGPEPSTDTVMVSVLDMSVDDWFRHMHREDRKILLGRLHDARRLSPPDRGAQLVEALIVRLDHAHGER